MERILYKSYKFVDDVPSVLEIVGEPSIINEAGKNVSEKFENISSNNHIEYRAKILHYLKVTFMVILII